MDRNLPFGVLLGAHPNSPTAENRGSVFGLRLAPDFTTVDLFIKELYIEFSQKRQPEG
ncbi:MAG: hypothetical protein NZ840_05185 [Anaerolineales bacterium]|nr:hypothetical protein [Anaerolineales bacterium]MDW8161430.1 hypothetical protein [Anaerolineales bacterium]